MTPGELVATYIQAKDSNRPELMPAVFAANAWLEMVVHAGSISFPPLATGLDAITDVLVRRFCETFENVHTFCISSEPAEDAATFSCGWLVGMSEKEGGTVRIGCGRYDWSFGGSGTARLVDRLRIRIDCMEVLPASRLPAVMDWLSPLPYPWCPLEMALVTMPRIAGLEVVARAVSDSIASA